MTKIQNIINAILFKYSDKFHKNCTSKFVGNDYHIVVGEMDTVNKNNIQTR